MKNKTPLYIIAIIASILSLLVANLIVSILNFNNALSVSELEDAIHNTIFNEEADQ